MAWQGSPLRVSWSLNQGASTLASPRKLESLFQARFWYWWNSILRSWRPEVPVPCWLSAGDHLQLVEAATCLTTWPAPSQSRNGVLSLSDALHLSAFLFCHQPKEVLSLKGLVWFNEALPDNLPILIVVLSRRTTIVWYWPIHSLQRLRWDILRSIPRNSTYHNMVT